MSQLTNADYEHAIKHMVQQGKAWLKTNTGKIKIQWNFPREAAVLCTVKEAKRLHLISLEGRAEEFVDAICANTPNGEASVLMLKISLELIERNL